MNGEGEEGIFLFMQKGISVASHDDDTIEKIDEMSALGVSICEFPINMETAAYAKENNMHVVGGASNVLRGGSLTGNLNIKDAILNGYVTSLCSDYYPPAIFIHRPPSPNLAVCFGVRQF